MPTIAEHTARIPPATLAGIREYVEQRIPPGCFLGAVLSNDLRGAVGWADDGNRAAIADIVMYLHWEVPGRCWGSKSIVDAWLEPVPQERKHRVSLEPTCPCCGWRPCCCEPSR